MQFLGEEGAYEMLDTKPQVIEMMKPPRNALGICPKCLCLDPPKQNYGFFQLLEETHRSPTRFADTLSFDGQKTKIHILNTALRFESYDLEKMSNVNQRNVCYGSYYFC